MRGALLSVLEVLHVVGLHTHIIYMPGCINVSMCMPVGIFGMYGCGVMVCRHVLSNMHKCSGLGAVLEQQAALGCHGRLLLFTYSGSLENLFGTDSRRQAVFPYTGTALGCLLGDCARAGALSAGWLSRMARGGLAYVYVCGAHVRARAAFWRHTCSRPALRIVPVGWDVGGPEPRSWCISYMQAADRQRYEFNR